MEQPVVNEKALAEVANALIADDKGLLAMDESTPTCNKRFAAEGIPQTEAARRSYRELLVTAPGLGDCINGAILYDETIRQKTLDGISFVRILEGSGIIPGIKVDLGAKDLAGHRGEKITEGLDGLRLRLQEYFEIGARFAKWRAVIALGHGIPAGPASTPMRRRWPAMQLYARNAASSRLLNRKFSWMVSIRCKIAERQPKPCCTAFSKNCISRACCWKG
jgi:fructose-bisphosphate aldolase class 1